MSSRRKQNEKMSFGDSCHAQGILLYCGHQTLDHRIDRKGYQLGWSRNPVAGRGLMPSGTQFLSFHSTILSVWLLSS